MNCIRNIDGRNGKSGGRVLFAGLVTFRTGYTVTLEIASVCPGSGWIVVERVL